MASTIIQVDAPHILDLVLMRLVETDAGQVDPSAAGYVLTPGLVSGYTATVSEACVGVYQALFEDGDGIIIAGGWVRIVADDTATYVVDESLQALLNDIQQEADQAAVLASLSAIETRLSAIETAVTAIQGQTDLIGTGQATVNRTVSEEGQIVDPIVIGDDYLAIHERAFVWTIDPLPTIAVGTATCFFGGASTVGGTWLVQGTVAEVTVEGETKWTLTFNMSKTVTGALQPANFDWSVEVRDGASNEVTRVRNINNDYRVAAVEKQT